MRFSTRRLTLKPPGAGNDSTDSPESQRVVLGVWGPPESETTARSSRLSASAASKEQRDTTRPLRPLVRHLVRLERATDSGGPMRSWGTGRVYG